MKKRFIDVMQSIDYYELLRMKKDLEDGSEKLKHLLHAEIKSRQQEHALHCATCGSEISPDSTSSFTLLFGPQDFKKKATFCGKDCLEHFLANYDKIKNGQVPKTQI